MLKGTTGTLLPPFLALLLKFDSCPSNSIGIAYKTHGPKKNQGHQYCDQFLKSSVIESSEVPRTNTRLIQLFLSLPHFWRVRNLTPIQVCLLHAVRSRSCVTQEGEVVEVSRLTLLKCFYKCLEGLFFPSLYLLILFSSEL